MLDIIAATIAHRSVAEDSRSALPGAPVLSAPRERPAARPSKAPVRRSLASVLRWSAERLAPAR